MFLSLFVCFSVCLLTTLHKNFQKDLHEIFRESCQWVIEQMNKWLNFAGDPDHHLDTGIVCRIRHYWEIRKDTDMDINLLLHPVIHSY